MKTTNNAQMHLSTVVSLRGLIIIFVIFTSMLMSCKKDEGESVNPQERIPFLGSYKVIDKNNNNGEGAFQFKLEVQSSSKGEDKVELKGFRYVNNGVVARIKGNKMYISQVLEDSDEKVEISGEGALDGDTLTYTYVLKHKKTGKPERVFENSATATRLE
ncbi:hypothetical protein Q0590_18335 [Rhodocytophaga aerolata]|uniref:Uncharacterized protein n=1 Tax=Rhodocytophaga aerolata TaxID=455078 RepID=A0ABT8RA79_9BACT|nr:hypothetical protein [Rhodocytophaga aerolata]MDO1448239.1 hypothetical protein [Rhodocytophaga aerolata]